MFIACIPWYVDRWNCISSLLVLLFKQMQLDAYARSCLHRTTSSSWVKVYTVMNTEAMGLYMLPISSHVHFSMDSSYYRTRMYVIWDRSTRIFHKGPGDSWKSLSPSSSPTAHTVPLQLSSLYIHTQTEWGFAFKRTKQTHTRTLSLIFLPVFFWLES